jgi:hypothetical protein
VSQVIDAVSARLRGGRAGQGTDEREPRNHVSQVVEGTRHASSVNGIVGHISM